MSIFRSSNATLPSSNLNSLEPNLSFSLPLNASSNLPLPSAPVAESAPPAEIKLSFKSGPDKYFQIYHIFALYESDSDNLA